MTLDLNNYRSSTEYREILRILQKASSLQENFVWQSSALGKNVIPIHHFEIDFVSREVVIYYDSQLYRLNSELPLYVKLDYRTSVFKIKDFRRGNNSINFSFPSEIKTQELRGQKRVQIPAREEKYITIRPSMASSGILNSLKVRAIDISHQGVGLIISEQNRSFLKNNRILWVTSIQDVELKYPVLAEVIYMNSEIDPSYRNRKVRELKVGLKLSGSLPDDVFNQFMQ